MPLLDAVPTELMFTEMAKLRAYAGLRITESVLQMA
jgi:hypothetical protein